MEFFRRAEGRPQRVGVLAGAFNPVTVAHLAIARAALSQVDEVVFVLPKSFPHKSYHGAPFADRVEILRAATLSEPAFSVAAADGGLLVEIAAECREAYSDDSRLTFLCGRDAAERILNWDYGEPNAVENMLRQFDLLVAARGANVDTVPIFRHSVGILPLEGEYDHVSSTEVRERIAQGLPWEHLAPVGARELVRSVYELRQPRQDGFK